MRDVRAVLILAVALSLAAGPALAQDPAGVTAGDRAAMSRLVDEFMAAYDPQNLTKARVLDITKRMFDDGPDFSMVVDAVHLPTFASRIEAVERRFSRPVAATDETGVHETLDERIQALGPDAAVLTRLYRFDFTEKSGRKGHQMGAVTCVFVRRGPHWKVTHYHGSHRPRELEAPAGQP